MDYGLYEANKLISDKLRAQGINTITFGSPAMADLNQNSILPIGHMSLNGSDISNTIQVYNYRIAVIDLVDNNDISPREVKNDLTLSQNQEDILHDLSERINKFKNNMRLDNNVIESSETLNLTVIESDGQNALMGYAFEFSITIEGSGAC